MMLESPWVLVLLIPTALVVALVRRRVRSRQANLDRHLAVRPRNGFWPEPPGEAPASPRRKDWGGLRLLAAASIILGLAGMGLGTREVVVEVAPAPIIALVDVSASMGVEDVPWARLGSVKNLLRRLAPDLEAIPLGLRVFADEAYDLLPPTVDQDLFFTYLDALDPTMVTGRGTALATVLEEAAELVGDSPYQEPLTFLLASDGDDESTWLEAEAAARSIQVRGGRLATVVAGTTDGGTVPIHLLERNPLGVPGSSPEGPTGPARSGADPERMGRLAELGGGPSLDASRPEDLDAFTDWLVRSANGSGAPEKTERRPMNRWPWFTSLAVFALLLAPAPSGNRLTRPRRRS